jgi:RNA recognition motif-containing protein
LAESAIVAEQPADEGKNTDHHATDEAQQKQLSEDEYFEKEQSYEQSLNNEDEKESAGISLADNCNVYVAGLPKRATEDIIRKEFSRFGTIQHVNLVRDYDTHVSKCFCYIMFATGKAANEAIKVMNKQQVFNEW